MLCWFGSILGTAVNNNEEIDRQTVGDARVEGGVSDKKKKVRIRKVVQLLFFYQVFFLFFLLSLFTFLRAPTLITKINTILKVEKEK